MVRKLFKIVTSRLVWSIFLIALELFLMGYLVFWASYVKGYYLYFYLLSAAVTIFVLTRNENPSYKVVWIALASIFPTFGGILYLIFGNKKIGHRAERRLQDYINSHLTLSRDVKEMENARRLMTNDEDVRMANYIYNMTGLPAYDNTEVYYYPTGEDFFADVFGELEKAEKYIFIEYFIIGKGEIWDKTLDILKRKVKEGVDVRVIYDDMGSINAIPFQYDKTLRQIGIKAYAFNPVKIHVNPRINFRDHRKILSIDGNVCYTGGLNLSDEYANRTIRFGYWKDNAIKLKGDACFSLTRLFLETWLSLTREKEIDLEYYRPSYKAENDGLVQVFGASPFFPVQMGENAYLNIINSAKKYIWIATPYLIPDDKLLSALSMAAESGIDVRIVTPNYPDKVQVHEVTRSNYESLIMSGVKIYEFTPGFVHSKMFLSDDSRAIVGTTNLDYRSFFLHFELSVAFYGSSVLSPIKEDFDKIFSLSKEIKAGDADKISIIRKAFRYFYKLFSPAL